MGGREKKFVDQRVRNWGVDGSAGRVEVAENFSGVNRKMNTLVSLEAAL